MVGFPPQGVSTVEYESPDPLSTLNYVDVAVDVENESRDPSQRR